ncbi:MAG: hypothetical protein IT456_26055 [Planctomycetes bacterium]|nr:hypothetical protein [Planctomycetota bacterium]
MNIDELRALVDRMEARKKRAATRLEQEELARAWFAMLGVTLDMPTLTIGEMAVLRRVEEPPGEVELACALVDRRLFSAVGRYSSGIGVEMGVMRLRPDDPQSAMTLGWWLVSAIRIRTLGDFLVPAVSDHPWGTIAALPELSCNIQLLEDVPRSRRLTSAPALTAAHLAWVEQYLVSFAKLLQEARFRLAVDCLTTHQHEASMRMTAASLWTGIEALFAVMSELRFRLASLAAAYLEPRGDSRVQRYRQLKRLYDVRSKVVHGAALEPDAVATHVVVVRQLLGSLLTRMIELGRVPADDEWDDILHGESPADTTQQSTSAPSGARG